MGATEVIRPQRVGHYTTTRYQTTHVQGGTIMAGSPDQGVLNPYLQHWQYSNLFVLGHPRSRSRAPRIPPRRFLR